MTNAQLWNSRFELLKEFVNEFDRLPRYSEVYKGVKIGYWVATQKMTYTSRGSLLPEKIKKLEAIGVQFESNICTDEEWNSNFDLLREFVSKFNRLPRYKEVYKDFKIGVWLSSQKMIHNNRGSLSEERVKKLESIGVILGDKQWNSKFELLKEFINEFDRFPKHMEHYKGIDIGRWLEYQKMCFKKGKLSKERILKIESIGIDFDKEKWNSKFELLKEFINEFNRFPKSKETYKGVNIGQWTYDQKRFFNSGKLSKDRGDKLKTLKITISLI